MMHGIPTKFRLSKLYATMRTIAEEDGLSELAKCYAQAQKEEDEKEAKAWNEKQAAIYGIKGL